MFVVGGAPAILVAFFYNRLHEPERWKNRREEGGIIAMHHAFLKLFTPQYRPRTILNSLYLVASIVGLWAGSVYVPSAITYLSEQAGQSTLTGARLASYSTAILGIGTVMGALLTPILAKRLDRRHCSWEYFSALMLIFLWLAFGYVFYLPANAITWFMICTFFLGAGRRELRCLFVLAPGTIRHRLPRERVCFYYQRRPLRGSGTDVSGGRDDPALWNSWHSRRADVDCFRGWACCCCPSALRLEGSPCRHELL